MPQDLCGGGDENYSGQLKQMARELGIEAYVEFCGWVSFKLVPSYVVASKVGVIPQGASEHTNTTIPHKLFQYMSLKRPVIVSDCVPLARIVQEVNCGAVFRSDDSEDLAGVIEQMICDGKRRLSQGERGYCAARDKYNWAYDGAVLRTVYNRLKLMQRGEFL